MTNRALHSLLSVPPLVLASLAMPACAEEPSSGGEPEPWLRVAEPRDGAVDLQVAQRRYERPGDADAPSITLVGAVHIAHPRYYANLKERLEAFDLVLYEGVGPGGVGEVTDDLSDERRVELTEGRIRLLGIALERARMDAEEANSADAYPATLEAVVEGREGRWTEWLTQAKQDAWGRPLIYSVSDDGEDFTLRSLGRDGEVGGKGPDRDLSLAIQPPLSPQEIGLRPGLQKRLAETFGLAFQLEEMNEDLPNWRNSDLTLDDIRARVKAKGGEGSQLFGMLDGTSGMAGLIDVFLGFIEALPGGSAMGRLMMIEMLAQADDTLMAAGMGEDAGPLIEVIIDERNQKVIDDLRLILDNEPEFENIGIIYGAGHMPDLVERMRDQLGYELEDGDWNIAMRVDYQRAGISEPQALLMRGQIRAQLEQMRDRAIEETAGE
jgi:hypothetical protein